MLANVLVAQAARVLSEEGERLPATGPSFRDATRVAGANTAIWRDIYLANADALVDAIDDTVRRLTEVRGALAAARRRRGGGAGTTARARTAGGCSRPTWPAARCTSCASRSRTGPGVVAEVALALGRAGVNIVDMALYPASDIPSGTIALWVAGDGRADEAEALVAGLGLTVARAMRFSPAGPLRGTLRRAARQVALAPRRAAGAMTDEPVTITGYLDAADTQLDARRRAGARRARRAPRRTRSSIRGAGPARGGAGRRRSTSATPAR